MAAKKSIFGESSSLESVKSIFGYLARSANRLIVGSLLVLVRGYQIIISPFTQPRCRYQPTCSEYTKQALMMHGLATGVVLSVKRLLKCHPFTQGGVDLVPPPVNHVAPEARNSSLNKHS